MPPLGQNALPKPILCLCFHFSWKHVAFTWHTRAKKGSAGKSNENIVVEERSIKAAEQDPSATIVANVCSTGATVVGSVNDNEFWQRRTQPPSFLLLLSHKMDVAIPQWSALLPGSQMICYNYHFCDNCFRTCCLQWCAVFHWNSLKWNSGCSMAVMIFFKVI